VICVKSSKHLGLTKYYQNAALKVNKLYLSFYILRCFVSKDITVLMRAFLVYERPVVSLDYCHGVLSHSYLVRQT